MEEDVNNVISYKISKLILSIPESNIVIFTPFVSVFHMFIMCLLSVKANILLLFQSKQAIVYLIHKNNILFCF